MNPEFENLFERCFEPASVAGYMDRLSKEIITRLTARGYRVGMLLSNGDNFIIQMSNFRHGSGIFHVKCIDNSIIEWRRYA